MNKISIGEVVKVAIGIYKERWKTLLLISFMTTIISTSTGAFSIIITSMDISPLQVLLSLVNLGVMLISSYFTYRLFVAMVIASNSALYGEGITMSNSYKEAKHTTWRTIGTAILMGLMLFIPILLMMIGVIFGAIFSMAWPIRGLFVVSGLLPTVYLGTIFYFAVYAAVLQPRETSVFLYSKQLVKGSFFKVLLIILIPIVMLVPAIASVIYENNNEISVGLQIIYSILTSIPSALVAPFTVLISLVTMGKLGDK